MNICGSVKKWPNEVNSYHKWAIVDCPSNFEVKAHSDDNVIEAIRHKKLPWEGWMWHPERDNGDSKNLDTKLLKSFFLSF